MRAPAKPKQQSTTPKNRTAGQKWCNLSQPPLPLCLPLPLLLLTPLCCLVFACDRKANINSTLAPRAKFASFAINSSPQQQQWERERQQQLETFAPRRGNFCQFIDEFWLTRDAEKKRKRKQAARQMKIRNNNKKQALPQATTHTHTHSPTHTPTPPHTCVCVLPRDLALANESIRNMPHKLVNQKWPKVCANNNNNEKRFSHFPNFPVFLFMIFLVSYLMIWQSLSIKICLLCMKVCLSSLLRLGCAYIFYYYSAHNCNLWQALCLVLA